MDRSRRGTQDFFPCSTGRNSVILFYADTKRAGKCGLFPSLGGKWNVYTSVSFILVASKLSALCSPNYLTYSKSTHLMFCQPLNSFISVLLILYNFTSSVIHVTSILPCVWEETPPILKCSIVVSRFQWCPVWLPYGVCSRKQSSLLCIWHYLSLYYMANTDTTDSELYSYIS